MIIPVTPWGPIDPCSAGGTPAMDPPLCSTEGGPFAVAWVVGVSPGALTGVSEVEIDSGFASEESLFFKLELLAVR